MRRSPYRPEKVDGTDEEVLFIARLEPTRVEPGRIDLQIYVFQLIFALPQG